MKFKTDEFRNARGGKAQLLDITCENCGQHVCFYQKDGPGPLMRLYVDRMFDLAPNGANLTCAGCKRVLAIKTIYEKERRPAYRLFAGAVIKRRTTLSELS